MVFSEFIVGGGQVYETATHNLTKNHANYARIGAADSAPFLTLGFIAFLDLTAASGGFGFADAD